MKYLLQFGIMAVLITGFVASENAHAVSYPCTSSNPCNYQVCGDHICTQPEFEKYMTTMFNVQRGNVTIPVNATGGNMPMTEPANVLYLGTMSYDDVASDGTLVIASTNHPLQGKASEFGIGFFKANGDPVLNQNYAITVTQKNTVVFSDLNGHTSTGMSTIITSPMPSASEPISLMVTLNGVGPATADPSTWTGVKDVTLSFAQGAIPEASPVTTNTTSTAASNTPSPEFGPLAPIILTVAILSVIIFARARLPKR